MTKQLVDLSSVSPPIEENTDLKILESNRMESEVANDHNNLDQES